MSRRDRIIQTIRDRCVVDPYTGCWVWQGADSGKPGRGRAKGRGHSYPRMNLDGGTVAVHRALFICLEGPIPPGKQLDHTCETGIRTRKCVIHTEMMTHLKNQRRRAARAKEAAAQVETVTIQVNGHTSIGDWVLDTPISP